MTELLGRRTAELEAAEGLSEEGVWAERLGQMTGALREIEARLMRPMGLAPDKEAELVTAYQEIEREATQLEAYGRQRRWV